MTDDATDSPDWQDEAARAEFEGHGFRADGFRARFLAEDGSTELRPVSGFTCDGLGVHRDGDYWRICALGSGQPLGLMPTVSATRRLCTRILQLEGFRPDGAEEPDAALIRRIRDMQVEIVEEEAEALRGRAEALAEEIAYLEEKASDFSARAMFGALRGVDPDHEGKG